MIIISRRPRESLNASFFHVIVQGQKREYIFKETRYKYEYVKLIRKYMKDTNLHIIAYCIMSNHAHFLIQTEKIEELSKFMHKVNTNYAKYYNYIESGRVGYVFRDRFVSEPITSQRYLVQCIKYIHFNPVKAKVVQDCFQYKFSSYKYFCQKLKEGSFHPNLSKEDYENICQNVSYEIEFLDIEKDKEEIIRNGIQEFLRKNEKNIYEIVSNRQALRKLIFYLKENKKLTYTDIGKYFEITRGSMQKLIGYK